MRRAAVVFLPIALVVVFMTRGGDETSAQAAVKRASATTVDASSSRFTLTWTGPQVPDDASLRVTIEGLMDYTRNRGRISYWSDSEVIFDGDITYMKWPLPDRNESAWLRYESGPAEPLPLNVQDRAMRNPIGLLKVLTGVGSDVREVGSEQVRGIPTHHYEGTLKLETIVDNAPPAERAELQQLLDFISRYQATSIPFGVWIDGDGIARRLRLDQSPGISLLIEYYDFGIPVTIRPPSPSQIMSHEDFIKEIDAHATDSDCGESDVGSEEEAGTFDVESAPEIENSTSELPELHPDEELSIDATAQLCLYETEFSVGASTGD